MDRLAAYCDERGLKRGVAGVPLRCYKTGAVCAVVYVDGIEPVTGTADDEDAAYESAAREALATLQAKCGGV